MHLYKLLEILLKEKNKLKNATVLFLRKKPNSVSSYCRGASNVILNDSPFNFGQYTLTKCRMEHVIELFNSYQNGYPHQRPILRAREMHLVLDVLSVEI